VAEVTTALLLGGAAACGYAAGWWPITQVARGVTHGRRMHDASIRIALAITAAVVLVVIGWSVGITPALPATLFFGAVAVVLAAVDVVEHRLPNSVLLPALGATSVLLILASALGGDWIRVAWAAAGLAAMFGLYLAIALLVPAAMGMGDVKLAALIGLTLGWFGWEVWTAGLLAGFVIGGLWASVALVTGRSGLRGSVPFGPSMLAGAILALLIA
jgi:leader peptidase (prepilin peptidase) / N-methyltransferase